MISEAITLRPAEAKVASEASIPPRVLAEVATSDALVQVLEWEWPAVFDATSVERSLMLEMSLPPLAGLAEASFPTIAPGIVCQFGQIFVRYPGIAIRTHAEGGLIRILRCTFSAKRQEALLAGRHSPSLALMQTLVNLKSEALRSQMRLLRRELEEPGAASAEAATALTRLLGIELERLLDQDFSPSPGGRLAPWQFRRIRERIESAGERPGVPELAQLCGISVRHLHRQFLNLTGVTISDYVEGQIVIRAKALLTGTPLAVRQIAQETGFEHANSFSRAFRRRTGMTPLQYRQQVTERTESAKNAIYAAQDRVITALPEEIRLVNAVLRKTMG